MKKKDLVVGTEYYSQSHKDWEFTSWGVRRVRVLDTNVQKWKWDHVAKRYLTTTYSSGKTGLLVMELDVTGKEQGQTVVTLASLRGEWEPTWKKVQANREQRDAFQKKHDQEVLTLRHRVQKVVAYGLQVFGKGVRSNAYDSQIIVDVELFAAMTKALDEMNWKYVASEKE